MIYEDFIVLGLEFKALLSYLRLELHNFPVDVQELSITLATKRSPSEVKLVSDPIRLSYIDLDASNTFIDQQKW